MSPNRPGFILVVSVLVLSSILLVIGIAAAFGIAGIQQRSLGIETNFTARSLSEACVETALMKLRADDAYTGNENIPIGSSSCTIRPIQAGPPTIIQTEATSNGFVYRLQVELASTSDLSITKWQRVVSF